ncbi:MAG: ABC transporter permease [Emcibacteraceae bacterium]|nr:ABC transporter permease [Emcibacteraceae bacterium]
MINILGLAIGLTAVMLITLFVRDELSYDNFWKNADNIYRPGFTGAVPGLEVVKFTTMPTIMRDAFMKDFPQVTHATRITRHYPTIRVEDISFQDSVRLIDADIINIFDFNIIKGDPEVTLSNTNGLVISETIAKKYFGNEDPIGKIISINFEVYERDYQVGTVIEDIPDNSMLDIAMLAPFIESDWKDTGMTTNWLALTSYFYFTLTDGSDIEELNAQMPAFIDRNFIAFESPDIEKESDVVSIKSINIQGIHLKAEGSGEMRPKGNMNTVIIFSAVSVLILIIASINFMNLSTARASLRAKEVSMRKVLGAARKHLIVQFLGESILLTVISLIIAIFFLEISLPFYNEILGKELSINYASADILQITILALFIGLVAGTYPAMFLSSYRPAHILRANKSIETKLSMKLRSALVILQFAVSITLFVSTAVVYGQMQYTQNRDLGYTKENLFIIETGNREAVNTKKEMLLTEIRRLPNVVSATTSFLIPGRDSGNITSLRTPDKERQETTIINSTQVGYEFFKTYKIEMLAGREYDKNRADQMPPTNDIRAGKGNTGSLILNESGLRRFGLGTPEEALGKFLYMNTGNDGEGLQREYEIIGIIPDTNFDSLKKEIRAEAFFLNSEQFDIISVRFTGDPTAAVENIRNIWQREFPSIDFEYEHVFERLINQYEAEQGQMTMFAAFSGLAISIACLGLFGLASFTAERRTKEIGIRKVFGADVFQIVKLLVWQFSKPVLIANIIAWPIAYLAMSRWLESFVYRVDDMVIIVLCLVAGLAALLIAWATVAGNSYAVARQNPIKALRYE